MSPRMFTADRAKAALKDIITAFSQPDNVAQLTEVKNSAGNDMLLHMQLVFPIASKIQMDVIQNYGFSGDKDGLLQFTKAVDVLKKENPELSQLSDELRHLLLPSVILPSLLQTST